MKTRTTRPFSAFQSLMRGWSELAPYNFIHALRLEEPAEVERWRGAATEALHTLGLTKGIGVETPVADIETHLAAELNRGFAVGELPLRFFVIETTGAGHWFGVVIDHWFADDFSGRALLQRMYANYRGTAAAGLPELFLAKRQPARRNWFVEWSNFFKQAAALRRARRIPLEMSLDFTVSAFRVELPGETLDAVRASAREQNATVHDVFLAAAAQSCSRAHPPEPDSPLSGIALASAMDLRRFETGAARAGFGLLISQYSVVEQQPESVPFPDLVARIAQKTRGLKAVSGRAIFIAGILFWRLSFSQRAKATVYQRGAPFAAGLSNVNLNGSWLEQSGIAEFRRVGPTGPVVPLVLMITTFRNRIFVDATYRTAAMCRRDAQILVDDFARRLAPIAR